MKNGKITKKFIFDAIYGFKFKFLIIFVVNLFFEKSTEILILPYILKIIGDSYSNGNLNLTLIILLTFIYTLCFCSKHLISAIFVKKFYYDCYYKFFTSVRKKVFNYLLGHSMNFFENIQSGVVTSKLNDISDSLNTIFDHIFTILSSIVIFLFILFLYYKIDIVLTIFLFCWSIVFLLNSYFSNKIIFKFEKNVFSKNSIIYGNITDNFLNISSIKSNSTQNVERCNIKKCGIDSLKSIAASMKIKNYASLILFSLISILMCFILVYSLKLLNDNRITIGTFVFIGQNVTMLSLLLKRFFEAINLFTKSYSKLCNGVETLITPYCITNKYNAKKIEMGNGKIEFKNVNFTYK